MRIFETLSLLNSLVKYLKNDRLQDKREYLLTWMSMAHKPGELESKTVAHHIITSLRTEYIRSKF